MKATRRKPIHNQRDTRSSDIKRNDRQVTAEERSYLHNGCGRYGENWLKGELGFDLCDLTSWKCFVATLSRPVDPSNLAVFRITFGQYEQILQLFLLLWYSW